MSKMWATTNSFKMIVFIYLSGMTLLLIDDYFPEIVGFLNIPKWLVVFVLLFIFITCGYFVRDTKEGKYALIWSIVFMVYCIFLMLLLTILGGTSQLGISLDNPVIWILIGIDIFEIIRRRKKSEIVEVNY